MPKSRTYVEYAVKKGVFRVRPYDTRLGAIYVVLDKGQADILQKAYDVVGGEWGCKYARHVLTNTKSINSTRCHGLGGGFL